MINVQPVAWQADLVPAVARVTRVTLTDLLNNTGGNPEERQALVDLLRGHGSVTARVLETRADGVSVLDLAKARVTIRLNTATAPGDLVLLSMDEHAPATAMPAAAMPAAEVKLSRSAMLINQITKPALNQTVAEIVSATPMTRDAASPQVLAHALQQAVRSSGLFYESHLRGWIDGRVPLQDLYAEPQARLATSAPLHAGEPLRAGEPQPAAEPGHMEDVQRSSELLRAGEAQRNVDAQPGSETRHSGEARPVVHPQLEPLVRQQLDTFEQQRIAWHGVLWPDQQAEILITGEPPSADTPQAPRAWRVQLALNTPTLGTVKADIALTGRRLEVRLNGEGNGVDALRKGRASLEHALVAHDLEVHPIRVTAGTP